MFSSGRIEFELWSRNRYENVEVAGESFHQADIKRLLNANGVRTADGGEMRGRAHLVPDPRNKYDRNAVEVRVQGALIGYLPREVAATHVKIIAALIDRGFQPVTACRVWGRESAEWKGTDRRGRDIFENCLRSRASLVLDEPALCVPVNLPPVEPHLLLPQGGALQLKGEEKHLDVLAPFVAASSEVWAYGTLSSVAVGGSRSEKQIVEVLIDGQVIGELTPAMSTHFLPAIAHLGDHGHKAGVRVMLKGNPLKVEAVLHAVRSHELSADWFRLDDQVNPQQPRAGDAQRAQVDGSVEPHASAPAVPDPNPRNAETRPTVPTSIPPRPSKITFQIPPGWPPAPPGWEPMPGWAPPADWPSPPPGWAFWKAV